MPVHNLKEFVCELGILAVPMTRFISVAVLGVWLLPLVSDAARLYLDPPRDMLQAGDATIIAVRLDVDRDEGVCVNTADVTITYPDTIQAVDTTTRNSIFPLWVERPTINEARQQITFAGGIPNGYCGRIEGDPGVTNVLAEIVFRALPINGEATATGTVEVAAIDFTNDTVLYSNDGFGTQIAPEKFGAAVSILPSTGVQLRDPWSEIVQADTIPPEPFSIQLERDDTLFGGDYYIVFNTTDKQSGIALYEVMEEPLAEQFLFRFGQVGAPWREAKSPYRLRDQTLHSTIRVRAIDKAGNQYVATFVPDPSLRVRVIHPLEWVFIALGSAFLVVMGLMVGILYRRRSQAAVTDDAESRHI